MPTILKIGCQTYVVKNDSAAAAVCKALIGAVRMEYKMIKVDGRYKDFYWPDDERQTQVAIETVSKDQILSREPSEAEVTAHMAMKRVGQATQKMIG